LQRISAAFSNMNGFAHRSVIVFAMFDGSLDARRFFDPARGNQLNNEESNR
jgi:hypothetical protein